MFKHFVLFMALITFSIATQAQQMPIDDTFGWSFIKVEGSFDADSDPKSWNSKLLGAFEYHYRLNDNITQFQSMTDIIGRW